MSTVWNKLDPGLGSIYANYLRSAAGAVRRVNVSLYYTDDLAGVEALGFETASSGPAGFANGNLDLANLERLAAHPGVVKLSFGEPRPLTLDVSVPNIRANEVWTRSGSTFADLTGKGVIIGVIDTGIDIHHPFFLTTSTTSKTTRILRIWDQGLEPRGADVSPDANLLSGGATYGVEYDVPRIMAGLGGLGDFRHSDTHGHGTHVASIAAGNGQDKFKFIGVAPEADLIVVKHIVDKMPQAGGVEVSPGKLFRDAVAYILNVAKTKFNNRPVVINASFGDQVGPHDGLTEEEDFLTHTFGSVGGRCFVAGAGNDGGKAQHASINFGAQGGQVVLPMYMFDTRTLADNFATQVLSIRLYYAPTVNPVTISLTLPDKTVVAAPALGGATIGPTEFSGGSKFEMSHGNDNTLLAFTSRGLVERNRFDLTITPNEFGRHHANAFYNLTVTATEKVMVHMWCHSTDVGQGFHIGAYGRIETPPSPPASGTTLVLKKDQGWTFPNPKDGPYFITVVRSSAIFEKMQVTDRSMDTLTVVRAQDGTAAMAVQTGDFVRLTLPQGVLMSDTEQIRNPASAANVIAVAGYDAELASLPLYDGSSRGPLVSYKIPASLVQPAKPDLAAPAVGIDAARSQGRIGISKKRRPITSMQGTSMAAPHVSGTVALMLQKKPQLTTQQIMNFLKTNVRAVTAPVTALTPDEGGAGRLDTKKTVDNTN